MAKQVCTKCCIEKPIESFYKGSPRKDGSRGRLSQCKACMSEANKKWCKANRDYKSDKEKTRARFKKYGITADCYRTMQHEQDSKCAICSKPLDDMKLLVDHCHDTGKVRGLLCAGCNTGIGLFKDSEDLLTKAIKYLKGELGE
jgi:hypothetical protein